MKPWLNLACRGALLAASISLAHAQQQPVLGVSVTQISVLSGSGGVAFIDPVAGGTGYTTPPTVTIGAPNVGTDQATATAIISTVSGAVVGFQITHAGSGYTSIPNVTIAAPPPPPSGQTAFQASAKAYLGSAFATPNESTGSYQYPIAITAQAVGTFPADGFTYEFFVNGTSIGISALKPGAGIPVTIGWTPPQPGSYFITVTASDGTNKATSLPVRYFAVGTVVNSPVDNTIVPQGSSVVLKADATVGLGFIKQIQFYDNGVAIGSPDTTIPYSLIYTPTGASHSITAQAIDNNGATVPVSQPITLNVVQPIAPLPTSIISSPADGSAIAIPTDPTANITIAVDASSTSGLIQKVELYIDGVLFNTKTTYPYTFTWHPTVIGTYHLVALTYDDKNNVVASTTSTTATTTPSPTTITIASPPTVTLTSPTSGQSLTDASPTLLQADATDSNLNGSIDSVQFYQDGVLLADVKNPNAGSTSTYSARVTLAAKVDSDGQVKPTAITARAVNNIGIAAVSIPVSVTVTRGGSGGGGTPIGNPPTVAITNPTPGSSVPVNLPVTITAQAGDTDGNVVNVQFLVNGQDAGKTSTYPYKVTWTPTNLGNYSITAKATDNDGNTVVSAAATVSVVDPSPTAPTVSITSPTSGATLTAGNPITIQANATDDVSVAKVQFYVNGVALGAADLLFPFNTTWTPSTPGAYTITARATDNVGNETTSAPAFVTVSSGAAPTVALTYPIGTTNVSAGTNLNLTANASDADGTVSLVQFLVNGIEVGSAKSAPYLATWAPSAGGTYTIVAQATDNAGNITVSSPATVIVSGNVAPTVKITSPTFGTSVAVSSSITVNATASDADGTIDHVTFYANGVAIGTDKTPPYSVTWTPTAEGTFRLSAVAIDNAGAATTSDSVIVIAGVPSSGNVDTVASGIYIGAGSSGSFAAINLGGSNATFIGYVPATQTLSPAKTYYFTDIPVDSSGEFQLTDASNKVLISGQFTDSGVSGTFADGNASVTFSGPNTFPQSGANTRPGYYTGSVSDHPGSILVGLVGVDAHITVYLKDGAFEDAGAGAVTSSGAFSVLTRAGNKISGMIDVNTGLLTGTLKRGTSTTTDNLTGAPSSGGSISDGSLRNISTRGLVGSGDGVLIAGFVVNGTSPKHVLIRALGPSLTGLGVSGAIANPALTLYNITGSQIGYNDDWGSNAAAISAAASQVGANAISSSSHDAALLATLNPGPYTAIVSGVGGATGVGLVELYDVDTVPAFSDQKMVNIATRGQVGTGDNILIAGFVVNGSAPKKVLIRGLGPALAPLGVSGSLSDPMLKLARFTNGSFTPVRENDNWDVGNDPALVRTAIAKVGAQPPLTSGSKDAALLLTLPPGIYSAQLSGIGGATGVGLLEVYEVQ